MQKFITKYVIILCLLEQIFASKILLISVFPGKSHWLTFEHIIRELLHRGHEITAITNYKFNCNNHSLAERYSEVLIDPMFDIEGGCEYYLALKYGTRVDLKRSYALAEILEYFPIVI